MMGDAFPELKRDPRRVASIVEDEERQFLKVIDRGLSVFDDAARGAKDRPGRVFLGSDIFSLHATLGFPADMTMQLARERGLVPDQPEYEKLWSEHIQISGAGRKTRSQVAVDLSTFAKTDDSGKYHGLTTEGNVLGWIIDDQPKHDGRLEEDAPAALLLDRTSFYAEQGGQVGDVGSIQSSTGRFDVSATERRGDWTLHWGAVGEGHIQAHQRAVVSVDLRRSDTMRNHTTTHLLNWAFRAFALRFRALAGRLTRPARHDRTHGE
jgi:alanyl-tRNA synthetase